MTYPIHTPENAPAASQPLLQNVQSKFGLIPNLLGELAAAPNVLKGYLELAGNCGTGTLSLAEQQIIQFTASLQNGCEYCIAAHSTMHASGLGQAFVDNLKAGTPLADTKHEALRQYAIAFINKKGWISEADTSTFLAAGYTRAQVLEVIMNLTLKYFSNMANHALNTPIDDAFQAQYIALSNSQHHAA